MLSMSSKRRAVTMMPNIFIFLEADVLGGRLGSKKWVQADTGYGFHPGDGDFFSTKYQGTESTEYK